MAAGAKKEKETCVVCTDNVRRTLGTCCHYVHRKCVLLSGKDKCPLCSVTIGTMTRSERCVLNKAKQQLSTYIRQNNEQLARDAIIAQIEDDDDDDDDDDGWVYSGDFYGGDDRHFVPTLGINLMDVLTGDSPLHRSTRLLLIPPSSISLRDWLLEMGERDLTDSIPTRAGMARALADRYDADDDDSDEEEEEKSHTNECSS